MHELDMSYLTVTPWTLYFDGPVCNEGKGIGFMLVSPKNVTFDFSSRLKAYCTNNQTEYEALLFSLELLENMGVKQILEEYQCLDGTLNGYL
jgi:ribonuclease HI